MAGSGLRSALQMPGMLGGELHIVSVVAGKRLDPAQEQVCVHNANSDMPVFEYA